MALASLATKIVLRVVVEIVFAFAISLEKWTALVIVVVALVVKIVVVVVAKTAFATSTLYVLTQRGLLKRKMPKIEVLADMPLASAVMTFDVRVHVVLLAFAFAALSHGAQVGVVVGLVVL